MRLVHRAAAREGPRRPLHSAASSSVKAAELNHNLFASVDRALSIDYGPTCK